MSRRIVTLITLLAAGCGLTANPQVKEIEIKDNGGGGLVITIVGIEYKDGGKLNTVTSVQGGQEQYLLEYTYDGDNIESIARVVSGQTVSTTTFKYKDDHLDEVSVDAGGTVTTRTLDYDGDGRLTEIATETQSERFEYDDKGRLERVTEEDGGTATVSTYSYEDEDDDAFGELETVKIESGGTPTSVRCSYADDRRLERVVIGNSYQRLSYGDDGLVEEIQEGAGSSQVVDTTRFTYGDGGIEGVEARLPVMIDLLFTFDGRRIDQIDPMVRFLGIGG